MKKIYIWTHEGPEKKEDSHILKRIYKERDYTKGVSIPSTIIHTRARLDLIV
jgi:hypothetical protein